MDTLWTSMIYLMVSAQAKKSTAQQEPVQLLPSFVKFFWIHLGLARHRIIALSIFFGAQ